MYKYGSGRNYTCHKNVVHLTYIINPGAAFGLFPHQDVLFLGIVMILLLAFAWLRDRIPQKPVYFPLSIGLLLGGAVGNALDRCRIGGVVDFLIFVSGLFLTWRILRFV